jgi:hypothetical protein
MKTLLPIGRFRSDGTIRNWSALAVAVGISCFPLVSALADGHKGGGGGGHMAGGEHAGGGGHMTGGGHAGGGGHMTGGGHAGGGGHMTGGGHAGGDGHMTGGGHAGGDGHMTGGGHAGGGGHMTGGGHAGGGRHIVAGVGRTKGGHVGGEQRATTAKQRTNAKATNQTVVSRSGARTHAFVESRIAGRGNRADLRQRSRAVLMNRTSKFDRSITRSRAQVLMDQRLGQISSRRWTGHGQVCSEHFDRDHGFRFRHGGYWWRCNFWGAHSYCNQLIAIGFAPGLCWGWYDDICWGNIVVGMPIDLIDYYYPDQAYTTYTTYNGDEATLYYYALGDGQYKRVTVVDGNVVDVQIVDEIV